jgi:BASS family bile acid:Na+ symporter
LWAIPTLGGQTNTLAAVPVDRIVMQLIILMVLPMIIGVAVKHRLPMAVKAYGTHLRGVSNLAIGVILVLVVWSARSNILAHYDEILLIAMLFLVAALMIGWLLGRGLNPETQSVLIIESGTRNVAVALLLGGSVLTAEDLPILAGFLAVYFIFEVIFMMVFARNQALRHGQLET